jgi:hypothetical protein
MDEPSPFFVKSCTIAEIGTGTRVGSFEPANKRRRMYERIVS